MDSVEKEYTMEELLKPIGPVEEKWKLLPHFLRMRGLMRQHIDSFNYFVNVDIKQIVAARSNCEVRSEADPKFFLRYTDIYVGEPSLEEEAFVTSNGNAFVLHKSVSSQLIGITFLSSPKYFLK
jgi:DNA-directed RNA polymerase III subunit RPC2